VLSRYAIILLGVTILWRVVFKMMIKIIDKERLQDLLSKKGITKSSLRSAANISESYAGRILEGKVSPSPQVAKKICELLDVSFNDIFYVSHGVLGGTKMGDSLTGW
jgi:transcriptional regulator with XRE-family HTH domain